jgi:flagellar hook-associated protein 2
MATGSISALGIGSGLELQSILDQLKEIDQQPITRKQSTVTTLEQKVEALNGIEATLLSMRTNALALSLESNFMETTVGVNGAAVTATSTTGADNLTHYVQVDSLASNSSWVSAGVAATTTEIASEDMTFAYHLGASGGTISLNVAAGTTLEGLVTLINNDEANPGVTASIADTGFGANPYKLVLRSDDTGEDNRIFIDTQLADTAPESDHPVTISTTSTLEITAAPDNNQIVFQERLADGTLGAETTASIADGTYTSGHELAAAIETAMESASTNGIDYRVSYDEDSKTFNIREDGDRLYELNISWDASSAAAALGFDAETDTWLPHDGLSLTESAGAGFHAPESDRKVFISAANKADISAANNNNEIIFHERLEGGVLGAAVTASIADGTYTSGHDLAAAVETAMETASAAAANAIDYDVVYDDTTRRFTITAGDSKLYELQLDWADSSAAAALGFAAETDTYSPYDASLNARLTVDNIAYQRQGNSDISDIIQGVTLNLETTGSATIGVTPQYTTIETTLQALVDDFNTLMNDLNTQSTYDIETGESGVLFGENTVTRIDDEIKDYLQQTITGLDGGINDMTDLGLSIEDDGTLSLDLATLRAALAENADDVVAFFIGDADKGITGFGDLLYEKLRSYTGTSGVLPTVTESTEARISTLEEQITFATELLNRRYDAMTQRFVQLDAYMRQMESQASFLDQMFAAQDNNSK